MRFLTSRPLSQIVNGDNQARLRLDLSTKLFIATIAFIVIASLALIIYRITNKTIDCAYLTTIHVGQKPTQIVINPIINRIYVANYDSESISIIDGDSNMIISTVKLKQRPSGMAINYSTNRVYIAGDNNIDYIDDKIKYVCTSLPLKICAGGISLNPITHKLYITDMKDTVDVVDEKKLSIITKINIGSTPLVIAINPTTNIIYVGQTWEYNAISVINGNSNQVIKIVKLDDQPTLAFNTTTNLLYFTSDNSETISIMDSRSNTIINSLSIGRPGSIAINYKTNKLYVINDKAVIVIDGKTNKVLGSIRLGTYPCDIAINTVTNRLYLSNTQDDTISVIQLK